MSPNLQNADATSWQRIARFARKPWLEKRASIGFRWIRSLPGVPFPIRLPNGCWWLVRNDPCGAGVLDGHFEKAERQFTESYLRPGMTVVDIGAHHGLYTLLASRCVGQAGRVIAFEPSPRELRYLRWHLKLNRCRNVTAQPFALGSHGDSAKLFLVEGRETGCNSLRPPDVNDATREVAVPVRRLDQMLTELSIDRVDWIKLDAEGGELEILNGMGRILEQAPRPVILAEVQDIRTRPWGYAAKEIISFLRAREYSWFRPIGRGLVEELESGGEELDGNFVAVPSEQAEGIMRGCEAKRQRAEAAIAAGA
jgi:FkbM family methyltransferase